MIQGATINGAGEVSAVTTVALVSGQVVQMPDGRAAVYVGLRAAVAADSVTLSARGSKAVKKSTSVAFLAGQEVWWNIAADQATYRLAGDFYVGLCTADATAAALVVATDMNAAPAYSLDLSDNSGEWTTEATNGLGVVALVGGAQQIAFDAVNEAAQAALVSTRTFDVDDGLIYEAEVAVFDIGDNAALDIDFGLVSASHATDLEAVTALAVVHFNGVDLTAFTMSDDGTTDVAADDSGVDVVDDTYVFIQVDARTKTNVKFYLNGAQLNSAATFVLTAYASTVKAIAHMEKTADDTSAEVRVRRITVRSRAAA